MAAGSLSVDNPENGDDFPIIDVCVIILGRYEIKMKKLQFTIQFGLLNHYVNALDLNPILI